MKCVKGHSNSRPAMVERYSYFTSPRIASFLYFIVYYYGVDIRIQRLHVILGARSGLEGVFCLFYPHPS